MGHNWHLEGKMMKKKNSMEDLIACAEYVVNEGYTNPDLLAGQCHSAGGLVFGQVANIRGELFKAMIMRCPFVDILTAMTDKSLPITVSFFSSSFFEILKFLLSF